MKQLLKCSQMWRLLVISALSNVLCPLFDSTATVGNHRYPCGKKALYRRQEQAYTTRVSKWMYVHASHIIRCLETNLAYELHKLTSVFSYIFKKLYKYTCVHSHTCEWGNGLHDPKRSNDMTVTTSTTNLFILITYSCRDFGKSRHHLQNVEILGTRY